MSTADQIIDQIDHALDDWTVSGDAMRSRPAAETKPAIYIAPLGTDPRDTDGWHEIGHLVDLEMTIDQATIDPAAASTEPAMTWGELAECINRAEAERARRAAALLEGLVRAFQAMKPVVESAGLGLAGFAEAMRDEPPEDEPPAVEHKPLPRRDRPAWQSPYGPPRQRR